MASSPCKAAPPPRHQDLPDEIIEDIFVRLPAKSVLRCRCLSRTWAATLSSDAFVDRHYDLANRHRELPRLCHLPRSAAASTVYAWSPELGKGVFTPLMAVPRNSRNGKLHAVTRSCRGVLLLRATAARMYYLCNPSIGQIVALPDGRMTADRPTPGTDYASFGLGYDARSRSHKVVRLLYHDSRAASCDIYDVGAGASCTGYWRPAAGGLAALPLERVRMNQIGVFVEGHVHWPTMGRHGEEEHIVSFSIADERFDGYVTPPPGTAVKTFALTELAGCLCLLSAPHCTKSSLTSIDIWLLTDYVTGSWEKHWHIDLTKLPPPPPELGDDFMFNGVTPLALVDGGRRILFVSTEYQVAAYCLATGTLDEVAIVPGFREHGDMGGAHHHPLVLYEESLVPAGRPFEDILWSSPSVRALSVALRRLPARTLGRLKLVCRRWRAMLESDRFATLHNACARATAATTPVSVAFLADFGTTTPNYVPLEFHELMIDPFTGPPVVSLESCSGDPGAGRWNPLLSTNRVVCRSPCHGLVLLSHQNGIGHALCNPVTQAVRRFVFHDDQGQGCAGLGYDPSREEHIVVRLSYTSRCLETRTYAMECRVWPARDLHPRTLDSQPPIPAAVDVPPVHVGGKMYWPRDLRLGTAGAEFAILAFDVCVETFEVVPAPPAMLGNMDSGDRMVLAELAGKLCAVNLSASMETMTVWGKNVEGWRREHVIELPQWPEFSPRTTELAVMPMAVDPIDGRILLDTGKALGYYDTRNGSLQTVYSLGTHIDQRYHMIYDRADGDGVFFIATVCEDSLLRPYDQGSRLW